MTDTANVPSWRARLWASLQRYPWRWGPVAAALLVAFVVVLYWVPGSGFDGYWEGPVYKLPKSLWDWLQLLIIPLAVAGVGLWFSRREHETERALAAEQHQSDQAIAAERQREDALETYLDRMSELLLTYQLATAAPESPARVAARARTLTVLTRLAGDGSRRGIVLRFLHEAGLIKKEGPIVLLQGADLAEINLARANLTGIHLARANLIGANLSRANLTGADLTRANLTGANLTRTNLTGANLTRIVLRGAVLRGAHLAEANLTGADLAGADLRWTHLQGAILRTADLMKAALEVAHLTGADLTGADLREASLDGADLRGTNLTAGRSLTLAQVQVAKNWEQATYDDSFRVPLGLLQQADKEASLAALEEAIPPPPPGEDDPASKHHGDPAD